MRKLLIFIFAIILLTGCSKMQHEATFMITHDDILYALYNQDGDQLTDFLYKSYEEVKEIGYIVMNDKDEIGVISLTGKEIIPFGTYETIEAVDQMFYATKKVEQKESEEHDDKKETQKQEANVFMKTNLYVLNSQGELLYSADEKTQIMKSGLPVILQDGEYIVLYHQGEELYHDVNAVKYVCQYNNSSSVLLGYEKNAELIYFSKNKDQQDVRITISEEGHYKILAECETGIVLHNQEAKRMIYVDLTAQKTYLSQIDIDEAVFDAHGGLTLKNNDQVYIYQVGQTPIQMNTYFMSSKTYLIRSSDIYGPHQVYKDLEEKTSLTGCQLYPSAQMIYSEVYPVYVKDEGYQYYNFDGQKVIENTFLYAEPFNASGTAIVKMSEEGYSIIDTNGHVLTKNDYYQIKYIGSSYYAVYNENGLFGIVNKSGEEILPIEYTSLPEISVVEDASHHYLLLEKNGRGIIYDIDDKMKEIVSQEGAIVYNDKGFFRIGNQYYTLEGELIE